MITTTLLGVDPGYDRLGWAVGKVVQNKVQVIEYGTISTKTHDSIFDRYHQILQELAAILATHTPTELAIESLFFSSNKTTALRVSETRGVIIGKCLASNLNIFEYNPTQVKQVVTGSGRADKKMIAKMIALQTKISVRDTLDDAIDAVAVLLTHSLLRNNLQI